jgi:hypothetical protein
MVQIANPPQPASGRWRFRRSVAESADGGGHFLAAAVRHYGRNADFKVLMSQACIGRHLSEIMDWIADGPEDMKKSVRAADELP